ncbi:MAG TPA: STAS domain-containing protein [Lamprocystis sp. (in: g-proteobacteria)]|nr:STAS domain-containing protein [Lamprocystis sp. (in: g-proteobacteria)]
MKVNVFKQQKDAAVIVLEGEFDALSAPATRAEFERLVGDETGDVIVDLGGVTFMDSSGAGALVFLHKRLVGQQRSLALVGVTGQPLDLLTLLRIANVIPVNKTLVIRPEQVGSGSGARGA